MGFIKIAQINLSTVSNPAVGEFLLGFDSSGNLKKKNSSGVISLIGGGIENGGSMLNDMVITNQDSTSQLSFGSVDTGGIVSLTSNNGYQGFVTAWDNVKMFNTLSGTQELKFSDSGSGGNITLNNTVGKLLLTGILGINIGNGSIETGIAIGSTETETIPQVFISSSNSSVVATSYLGVANSAVISSDDIQLHGGSINSLVAASKNSYIGKTDDVTETKYASIISSDTCTIQGGNGGGMNTIIGSKNVNIVDSGNIVVLGMPEGYTPYTINGTQFRTVVSRLIVAGTGFGNSYTNYGKGVITGRATTKGMIDFGTDSSTSMTLTADGGSGNTSYIYLSDSGTELSDYTNSLTLYGESGITIGTGAGSMNLGGGVITMNVRTEYANDESASYTDRSLVDKAYVDSVIGAKPYKVYSAYLHAANGVDPDIIEIFENELGGTVVWTREAEGYYRGTLVGAFPVNKTMVLCQGSMSYNFKWYFGDLAMIDYIEFLSFNNAGTQTDFVGECVFFEIRVYN